MLTGIPEIVITMIWSRAIPSKNNWPRSSIRWQLYPRDCVASLNSKCSNRHSSDIRSRSSPSTRLTWWFTFSSQLKHQLHLQHLQKRSRVLQDVLSREWKKEVDPKHTCADGVNVQFVKSRFTSPLINATSRQFQIRGWPKNEADVTWPSRDVSFRRTGSRWSRHSCVGRERSFPLSLLQQWGCHRWAWSWNSHLALCQDQWRL